MRSRKLVDISLPGQGRFSPREDIHSQHADCIGQQNTAEVTAWAKIGQHTPLRLIYFHAFTTMVVSRRRVITAAGFLSEIFERAFEISDTYFIIRSFH